MLRVPLIAVTVLATAGFAAFVAPAGAARTKTVALEDVDFAPTTTRIARGDRVRWVWKDAPTPHNVRSRGTRRFKSSGVKTEGSHTVRFSRRGIFRYVCTIHVGMDGKVVVR